MRLFLLPCLLALSCALSACDPHASPPVDPADLMPALLESEPDSDGQSAPVGRALVKPLEVRLVNRKNQPLGNVEVRWALTEGSATLGQEASTTDAEGRARVTLTLGTAAGLRRVRATVAGLDPVTLTARGLPGPVARVVVTAPAPTLEEERTLKLQVALADAHDNPITGRAVTWASADESVAVVDGDGTVRGVKPGQVRLTATSEGVGGHVDLSVVRSTNAISFTGVAVGDKHACATMASGEAHCWGADNRGALGNGADTAVKRTPSPVSGLQGVLFTRVVAKGDNGCLLAEDGAVWCWGPNDSGQLGNGTTTASDVPVRVTAAEGVAFRELTQSSTHVCGLTAEGEAWCWGYNLDGNLGDGTTENRSTPVRVLRPTGVTGWSSVSPGGGFTCGVSLEGDGYCWGWGGDGQLGDGTDGAREKPEVKVALPEGVRLASVHAAYDYVCAVSSEGQLYCWGRNDKGQLGDGTLQSRLSPVKVAAPEGVSFASASGESERMCALTKEGGEVWCWGSNPRGQLGNKTQVDSRVPVKAQLPAGVRAASVSVGALATCATTTAGEAFCWGENLNGLLGNGSEVLLSTVPVKVTEPAAR